MLPVRCHKLKQRASTLKPVSSKDEDEGLYAPTPKCFKSYLPLKQKLLTHTPSGRTPMCVSIPFFILNNSYFVEVSLFFSLYSSLDIS